ncbi:3-phosphoserine/phosphohydroxythreonine transaminase [Fluoribacter gormanii]|uniref:3-phosphoserine/phosphohydroxythreonine transaminase n=1 Tax=Fluoribacter gormanii TaxID=464 RepID=UPI002244D234|nr:3-phosphoserine/phosphohydroxythreonine transaminase [Fluoribacter gormanii]MCW8444389.1 3-phosphoserine/phosphohydroxythreonine transaminase [Fluoribacter gormanii]MCW8469581.1 3-phosphoserine/phosphohydroxythreonine transaminase [Fluoribacter gormanii]
MYSPINFNAGPATLPVQVLDIIHKDLFNWNNTGVSILTIGHRTSQFAELGERLEASVRRLLHVPDDFTVLFLPGGAQIQFAMIPMNLTRGFQSANYIETGYWSAMAIKEAQKYTQVRLAASSKDQQFTIIPPEETWELRQDAAFLHFTDNETIGGVEFPEVPQVGDMVLVSDMSSNIFSKPIDFNRLGCIYACAQKNFGIAGMSLVIVRRDLLDRALPETPAVFNYAMQDKNHSLLATPTTFAWYVASLICDWVEQEGGVAEMEKRSLVKAKLLYTCIDQSNFYHNSISALYRSRMNVPFLLPNQRLEEEFFLSAKKAGLLYLEGHRSVGGARASIYNAISLKDVERLTEFLNSFAKAR